MLEATGIDAEEERVYRLLVATFDGDPGSIADRLGTDPAGALSLLESLRSKGLVSRHAGPPARYLPVPPDVGFGPLLLRGQETLEWARGEVARLTEDYRTSARRRDAAQLVEVVTGTAAIRQQLANLQHGAREEIVWFCRAGHVAMTSEENTEEFDALARGVRYRVLYERALLEQPGMIENVAAGIRQGEIARATTSLPVRLAVADRSLALCPLVAVADGLAEPTAALVRESSLLAALLALFESYWERASPLRIDAGAAALGTGNGSGRRRKYRQRERRREQHRCRQQYRRHDRPRSRRRGAVPALPPRRRRHRQGRRLTARTEPPDRPAADLRADASGAGRHPDAACLAGRPTRLAGRLERGRRPRSPLTQESPYARSTSWVTELPSSSSARTRKVTYPLVWCSFGRWTRASKRPSPLPRT